MKKCSNTKYKLHYNPTGYPIYISAVDRYPAKFLLGPSSFTLVQQNNLEPFCFTKSFIPFFPIQAYFTKYRKTIFYFLADQGKNPKLQVFFFKFSQ